jgi:hypothetical protein
VEATFVKYAGHQACGCGKIVTTEKSVFYRVLNRPNFLREVIELTGTNPGF